MLDKIFPVQADNAYRGRKLALWILGVITLLNGVIGFNSAFNTRDVATSADGIPVDAFSPAAQQTVLDLFALLGVGRIVIFALGVVILIRYRALASMMFVLLLFGQIGSRLIHYYRPTPTVGSPPGSIVITTLLGLTVLGLGLSLWKMGKAAP